jgi:hypothetical protein
MCSLEQKNNLALAILVYNQYANAYIPISLAILVSISIIILQFPEASVLHLMKCYNVHFHSFITIHQNQNMQRDIYLLSWPHSHSFSIMFC